MDAAVKIVEEITPVFKNSILILILCQLIVDIIKPDTFGICIPLYPADPILSHLFVSDRLLYRKPLFFFFL